MKTPINLIFYQNIIISDFCLVKQSLDIKPNFFVLNIYKTIISLQLVIKQIQFIKKHYPRDIYFKLEDSYYYLFIKTFLDLYPIKYNFKLYHTDFPKEFDSKNSASLVFIINHSGVQNFSTFKKLLDNNMLLINQVGIFSGLLSNGHYQFNSDLFDIKKLIFFLVLFNKI